MRSPNGYGGISNLGGNRRNPFRVRITTGWEYDEKTGKQKQKYSTLGYYPTRKDAMIALAKYNENPYDVDKRNVTFAEIYEKWAAEAYPRMKKSSIKSYTAAYKNLGPLHDRKIKDLKKNELQAAINMIAEKSASSQNNAKVIINYVFKYCMENDIVEKDYSQFVTIAPYKNPIQKHISYTVEEIKLLWDSLELPVPLKYSAKDIRNICPVDLILIMIYTGMRPGELLEIRKENIYLDERYMIGGFKTEAGKDRIIPIHEEIFPVIKKRYAQAGEWLVPYKSDHPPTMNQYRVFLFDPVMEALKLKHLPHDGRHTFATFADRCKIRDHYTQLIMGHKVKNFTKEVYTHITPEELVDEVNKIVFLEK